ncbi:MAG: bacterioferritin [Myxococcota bacterium]
MKGKPEIVALLNEVLGGELVAINQYFMHAKMCEHWGYERIGAIVRHESIDEMKHAETLMDHILYLEGIPNLQKLGKLNIGETVKEQLLSDLELEKVAIARLNKGVALCREHGDGTSEQILRTILVDEEKHADWIETQLDLMDSIGEKLYLAQQMHKED